MRYPSIKMIVKKDLYLEIIDSHFLREEGNAEVWSKEEQRWTVNGCSNNNGMIKAGRFLSFKNYLYAIINPVTEKEKKNSIIIIMNELDSFSNDRFQLGQIEIHPYELNSLIKQDAIEIV